MLADRQPRRRSSVTTKPVWAANRFYGRSDRRALDIPFVALRFLMYMGWKSPFRLIPFIIDHLSRYDVPLTMGDVRDFILSMMSFLHSLKLPAVII